jgi:hypothetical protein
VTKAIPILASFTVQEESSFTLLASSVLMNALRFLHVEAHVVEHAALGRRLRRVGLGEAQLHAGMSATGALLRTPASTQKPDVLARIADHTIQNLDQLLPWNWQRSAAKLAA